MCIYIEVRVYTNVIFTVADVVAKSQETSNYLKFANNMGFFQQKIKPLTD